MADALLLATGGADELLLETGGTDALLLETPPAVAPATLGDVYNYMSYNPILSVGLDSP